VLFGKVICIFCKFLLKGSNSEGYLYYNHSSPKELRSASSRFLVLLLGCSSCCCNGL